ncbi:MAG: alpha-amylase family protein [Janthinobacterium lividum]
MNRREFAALSSAAAMFKLPGGAGAATGGKPWHQRIKRVLHINFNKLDPLDMDVESYADLLAAAQAQVTFLSVTGSVSFYPSAVPDFPQAAGLKGRDLFGECVSALRKRGIRVVGRFSPDIVRLEAGKKHPDWFRREKDGSIARRGAGGGSLPPNYGETCQFTAYYDTQIPAIMRGLVTRYDVDGLYTNGWPNTEVRKCWCAACHKIADPDSPAYVEAYQARAIELWKLYTSIAKTGRADRFYTGNITGGLRGGQLDLTALTKSADVLLCDNQNRGPGLPAWDSAQQARLARDVMGDRTVLNLTGGWARGNNIWWRNATQNAAELQTRMAQTAAAGAAIHYHWLGDHQGFKEDRRWQAIGRDYLAWQAKNDAHFHTVRSLHKVAMIVSPLTNRLYPKPDGSDAADSVQGLYAILLEARVPFDLLTAENLTRAKLARYSTVLLPNVAILTDAQLGLISEFVGNGGSLMSSFETGLYDVNGKLRADFAFGRMFGMRRAGDRASSHQPLPGNTDPYPPTFASYHRIEAPHPIFAGFHDTNWIAGPNWTIPIEAEGKSVATLIDPWPIYPTEQTYSRAHHTAKPAVVLRERGRSRLAHFAGDVEGSYWRTGDDDLATLVANTVRWVAHDDVGPAVEGDGLIETLAWATEPGYTVHLLNYTNPNAYANTLRKHYRLGPQTVRMMLSGDAPIRRASLLRAGTALPFQQSGRTLSFTVPGLAEYEVAAFET